MLVVAGEGGADVELPRHELPATTHGLGPEAWLQRRIMANPALLLCGQASPRHASPAFVCCELPLLAGLADWLGVTATGEIVIAEVKLGRNAEARREIVAQALDYYAALRSMSYDDLEAAAMRGKLTAASEANGLYEISGNPSRSDSLSPEEFRARIESNLRTGSILLVLALDRVPPSLARLVEGAFADQPALPFHVSIVECSLYTAGEQSIIIAPALKSRIVSRERLVIRVEGPHTVHQATIGADEPSGPASRPGPRSQAQFLAALEHGSPGTAPLLGEFLHQAARLKVVPEVARSMVLRLDDVNLGSISVRGVLEIYPTEPARRAGRDAFMRYLMTVARLAGVTPPDNVIDGTRALRVPLKAVLGAVDEWIAAIRDWQDASQSSVDA